MRISRDLCPNESISAMRRSMPSLPLDFAAVPCAHRSFHVREEGDFFVSRVIVADCLHLPLTPQCEAS